MVFPESIWSHQMNYPLLLCGFLGDPFIPQVENSHPPFMWVIHSPPAPMLPQTHICSSVSDKFFTSIQEVLLEKICKTPSNPQSIWATITKYHRLVGLYTFLTVLENGKSITALADSLWWLLRALFLFHKECLLTMSSHDKRTWGLCVASFCKIASPVCEKYIFMI